MIKALRYLGITGISIVYAVLLFVFSIAPYLGTLALGKINYPKWLYFVTAIFDFMPEAIPLWLFKGICFFVLLFVCLGSYFLMLRLIIGVRLKNYAIAILVLCCVLSYGIFVFSGVGFGILWDVAYPYLFFGGVLVYCLCNAE